MFLLSLNIAAALTNSLCEDGEKVLSGLYSVLVGVTNQYKEAMAAVEYLDIFAGLKPTDAVNSSHS